MDASVFNHSDYREYLKTALVAPDGKSRGLRARLAEAVGCNNTYISQILSGRTQMSLEQAERASRFLSHTEGEAHFYMLLVLLERAGTPELKRVFKTQIQKIKSDREVLKNRLEFKEELTLEDQATYYSAWYFTAIHFLLTIPGYQEVGKIATHLKLSKKLVSHTLEFLVNKGFVERDQNGKLKVGDISIHLGSDSPMLSKHHINWRMRAVAAIEGEVEPEDLHYSSIITLSEKDIPRVRQVLIEAIESVREVVRPSENEALCCYTLDLFRVGTK